MSVVRNRPPSDKDGRKQPHIGPVMVGVDGSPASDVAIRLGAWEAQRRDVPLVLVHGHADPAPADAHGWIQHGLGAHSARDAARALLTAAERRTQAQFPDLSVRSTMISGGGAGALVELSAMASLVVTGSRGSGGFAGLLVGSVSAQVAAHARTPVLVARGDVAEIPGGKAAPMPPPGPVVVGIDGSSESGEALMFGLEEAKARTVALVAILVWWGPPGEILAMITDEKQAQAEADQLLTDMLTYPRSRYPDVDVQQQAIHAKNTASALIDASSGAGLTVVGSRGRGGFASLLLGSVSRAVLGHAHSPVAIVRKHS